MTNGRTDGQTDWSDFIGHCPTNVERQKDILILSKGSTDRLDDTKITAAAKDSINFTKQQNKFCLSLHYNGSNSFLFVNGVKIYQFKAKDSEINASPLSLGNISKDFAVDNMKKTGLHRYMYDFSVDSIDIDDSLDIHKYLIKKHDMK